MSDQKSVRTHDPRLSRQERLKLQWDMACLGEWPENAFKRKAIQNKLDADDAAQLKDKNKGKYKRSRSPV